MLAFALLVALSSSTDAPAKFTAEASAAQLAAALLEEVPATRLIYLPGRFVHLCPGEVEVHEGVTRRLGRSPFAEPAERLVVLALEGDGEGPERARMELFDGQMESLGARVLESTDGCDELVEAAELAISIAVAPTLALAPVAPPIPEVPLEPPPIEPRVEEAAVAEVEEPKQPYMSWMPLGSYLRFGGGVHSTVLIGPQATVGAQIVVALRSGSFEVAIEQKQELPAWHDALGFLHGSGVNTLLGCGEVAFLGDGGAHTFGVVGCASGSSGSVWTLGDVIGAAPYLGLGGRLAGSWTQPDGSVLRPWAQVEWAIVRPAGFYADQGVPWPDDAPVSVTFGVTYEVAWGR